MGRKGQVVIFVILGLLIILSLFLYFVARNQTDVFNPEVVVPPDVVPIKRYVESCLYDSAREGLLEMGMKGGFIEVPDRIVQNRQSYIGEGRLSSEFIPHWVFEGEIRMPSLSYMEAELEEYVINDLEKCTGGFDRFDTFSITSGEPKVDVMFAGRNTVVKADFPLEIRNSLDRSTTRINEFGARVPVRMRRIHELANQTLQAEIRQLFLENVTMELMTADMDFPFTGLEIECEPSRWYVSDLKEHLQKMVYYNFPRIRVAKTNYTPFLKDEEVYEDISRKAKDLRDYLKQADYNEGDPFQDAVEEAGIENVPDDMYEYSHLYFDVGADHPEMRERFIYNTDWGMDFVPEPSDGGVMSSRQMRGPQQFLGFLCLNMYHFSYDITIPIEVRIVDPLSLKSEGGYMFRYAIPVTIRNNEPFRQRPGIRLFDSVPPSGEFCGELSDRDYEIEVKGISDGYTDQPLEGVNLTYQCMDYYCSIATTSAQDGTYKYEGPLPGSCTNPYIIAEKEGYLKAKEQMTSEEFEMTLEMLHPMNITFEEITYDSEANTFSDPQEFSLGDNESIVLYISLLNETFSHEQYVSVPYGRERELSFLQRGGTYRFNVLHTKEGDVQSGYMAEEVEVSYQDIAGMGEVTIPLVRYTPQPTDETERSEMLMFLYDGGYSDVIRPGFT